MKPNQAPLSPELIPDGPRLTETEQAELRMTAARSTEWLNKGHTFGLITVKDLSAYVNSGHDSEQRLAIHRSLVRRMQERIRLASTGEISLQSLLEGAVPIRPEQAEDRDFDYNASIHKALKSDAEAVRMLSFFVEATPAVVAGSSPRERATIIKKAVAAPVEVTSVSRDLAQLTLAAWLNFGQLRELQIIKRNRARDGYHPPRHASPVVNPRDRERTEYIDRNVL